MELCKFLHIYFDHPWTDKKNSEKDRHYQMNHLPDPQHSEKGPININKDILIISDIFFIITIFNNNKLTHNWLLQVWDQRSIYVHGIIMHLSSSKPIISINKNMVV